MVFLIKDITGKVMIEHKSRGWCSLPYYEKKGCPNVGKRCDCPPNTPFFEDYFDMNKNIYAIITTFNIKNHIKKMKSKHKHWSIRQCKNVIYWQGTVKRKLKEEMKRVMKEKGLNIMTTKPEAYGVNVIRTIKRLGIPIRPKPKDIVYFVGFIGNEKVS